FEIEISNLKKPDETTRVKKEPELFQSSKKMNSEDIEFDRMLDTEYKEFTEDTAESEKIAQRLRMQSLKDYGKKLDFKPKSNESREKFYFRGKEVLWFTATVSKPEDVENFRKNMLAELGSTKSKITKVPGSNPELDQKKNREKFWLRFNPGARRR
ncbi:hypothetical protein AYI70_g11068, partial [Smittium culicis]